MRVVTGAVVDVFAGEIVGVFTHVERADQDGTGGFQPLDQSGVTGGRRRGAVDLRSGERREAGDVEQVLDRERNAGERSERFAAPARLVERARTIERTLFGRYGESVEQRIAVADASNRRFGDLDGASAAVSDRGGDLSGAA